MRKRSDEETGRVATEEQLKGWTGPSSDTEQDKQDRTERMIGEAIDDHAAFDDCSVRVFAKGSYANNTNGKNATFATHSSVGILPNGRS